MLDGQQRTISFCQFVNGDFSIDNKYFHTLTDAEQNTILNYEVRVYVVEGKHAAFSDGAVQLDNSVDCNDRVFYI